MLEVTDIHVFRGEAHVLQGVSLTVAAGETVCLLGRNGAGKTTTIRSILGYLPPAEGEIRFDGESIARRPVHWTVRRGIGYVPEDRRIFPDLTVAENLEVAALPPRPGMTPWTAERIYETFPLLAPLTRRPGGALSGGEQQMLSIARALAGNPRLLLLDEPCEGLAPVIVEAVGEVIRTLTAEIPVLLAEQNARFAIEVSDRGVVIDKGTVRFSGSRAELLANREVQSRYLAV